MLEFRGAEIYKDTLVIRILQLSLFLLCYKICHETGEGNLKN